MKGKILPKLVIHPILHYESINYGRALPVSEITGVVGHRAWWAEGQVTLRHARNCNAVVLIVKLIVKRVFSFLKPTVLNNDMQGA